MVSAVNGTKQKRKVEIPVAPVSRQEVLRYWAAPASLPQSTVDRMQGWSAGREGASLRSQFPPRWDEDEPETCPQDCSSRFEVRQVVGSLAREGVRSTRPTERQRATLPVTSPKCPKETHDRQTNPLTLAVINEKSTYQYSWTGGRRR